MGIQIRGSDDSITPDDGTMTLNGISGLRVGTVDYPATGPLSNRNLIINGNFAINQRGGSNTAINTYALDRWRSYGGPMGFTISQQDVLSTLSTSRYAMRFQRTSGNTQTNNTGVVQGIESKNCEGLAGTQLTLSFKARAGADLSSDLDARFFYGTGTDENPVSMTGQTNDGGTDFTLTTSFATYTKTVTVPASATQISLAFAVTPTGTAGTNDWFEVTEVQVERGSVATPFEHRSYGDELARCQRYFERRNINDNGNTDGVFGIGNSLTSSNFKLLYYWNTTKRSSASITLTLDGGVIYVRDAGGNSQGTTQSFTVTSISSNHAFLTFTANGGTFTAGGVGQVRVDQTGSGNAYFSISAEL